MTEPRSEDPRPMAEGDRGVARAVAFWIVAVAMGGAALAFGSVESWAEAWLRVLATTACTALVWDGNLRRLFGKRVRSVVIPASLIVVWGALQSVPLPRSVVHALSPRTAQIQSEIVPPGGGRQLPSFLLSKADARGIDLEDGAALGPGPNDAGSRAAGSSLSIAPNATRRACLAWIAPLLFLVATALLSRDAAMRYRLLWAVAAWTGVLGAIAVAQRVSGSGKLLWIRATASDSRPLGPFVNPNNFAGWIEMGLLVILGLMLAIVARGEGATIREKVRSAVLDRSWALPRLLALASAAILGACGLVLSGSRGGAIAFAFGLAVMLPLSRVRAWLPAAVLVVSLAGLAVGLASWLGPERATLKTAFFAEGVGDPSLATRSDIWGRTWRILVDHPVVGTGLGTFRWAYASYDRPGEWQGTLQAHNDYLQIAAETGFVGVVLLAWLMLAVARRVLLPAIRPRSGGVRWTTAALAAAVFAMLVHSVIDFNLQIPAVAVLFAVIGGMLTAAADDPPIGASESATS